MSDNIKQEFFDLYKQASKYGVSDSEKNRLVERIIKLTHHPDFCGSSRSNTSGNSSNNSIMYQTNVYCGPGNAVSQTGNTFGPIGYNLPNFS